jgi:hypothetical protein
MSFLTEFKTIVTKLEAEGHGLAGKASNLFGTTEKIVTGLASELAPAFDEIKTEIAALNATVEAALGNAPVIAPAGPAAPAAG